MNFKIKQIWREHTYNSGKYKGQIHQAFPLWNEDRGGYDTYPIGVETSNRLSDAEVVESLEKLYEHLILGRKVRCIIPTTAQTQLLRGKFSAIFEQN